MGWPARRARIASKWWGCPSACLAIVAADRRGAPWVAVASTGCPLLCPAAMWSLACWVLGGVPLVPWRRVHVPLAPVAGGGPGSLAVGSVAVVVCACSKTGCTPHVLPHLLAWGCPVWVAALRMWLSRSDLSGHSGCCRNGTWCAPTRWSAFIWFGVTRTRWRVVPARPRVVVLPVGPPPPIGVKDCQRASFPAPMIRLDDVVVVGQ